MVSNIRTDSIADFLVGDSVDVCDAQDLPITSHFHGSDSSLEFCIQSPCFAGVEENGENQCTQEPDLMLQGDGVVSPDNL